ncbi:MAG: phosphoribosyl-AMP cyclohydrolase [Hyphomicrobiaceae bacterium]
MPDTPPTFPVLTEKAALENGDLFSPQFDAAGLIPAIVTDTHTGQIAMFAWMNAEALALTLSTGIAHFWSRSRAKLWKKGEESGNLLRIVEMLTDCDQDALIVKVEIAGEGRACHTGETSCFYRRVLPNANDPAASRLAPLESNDIIIRLTSPPD